LLYITSPNPDLEKLVKFLLKAGSFIFFALALAFIAFQYGVRKGHENYGKDAFKVFGSHSAYLSLKKKYPFTQWNLPVKFFHLNSRLSLDLAASGKRDAAVFVYPDGLDPSKAIEKYGSEFYIQKLNTTKLQVMGNRAFYKKHPKLVLTTDQLKELIFDPSVTLLLTHHGSGGLESVERKLGMSLSQIIKDRVLFFSKQEFYNRVGDNELHEKPIIFFCNSIHQDILGEKTTWEQLGWMTYQWFDAPRLNTYIAVNRTSPYFENVIKHLKKQ